jgi:ankyrin repeat protein
MQATPMYVAAFEGHTEVVNLLVNHKADIHCTTTNGATPLYVAAQNGHVDTMVALIKAGADINHPNKNGIQLMFTDSIAI